MLLAKIISSESHLLYQARVIEKFEAENPPSMEDFGFGYFVRIPTETAEIIGIICDSVLYSPAYITLGPRFVSQDAVEIFAPDQLAENAILISILLLGHKTERFVQGVPKHVVPIGASVFKMDESEVEAFHRPEGKLEMRYFAQIVSQLDNKGLALPLIENIIEKLRKIVRNENERKMLEVLHKAAKLQLGLKM